MLTEQMPRPLLRHLQASFPPGWKLPVEFEVNILLLVLNQRRSSLLKVTGVTHRAIKHDRGDSR